MQWFKSKKSEDNFTHFQLYRHVGTVVQSVYNIDSMTERKFGEKTSEATYT